MSEAKATSRIAGDETVLVSWELLKAWLRLREKCRCEGTYCYCFLIWHEHCPWPVKNIEWSRKVFQLEHGAQLRVCDMRRAPNCFLLGRKKLPWQQYHSQYRQVQTAIAMDFLLSWFLNATYMDWNRMCAGWNRMRVRWGVLGEVEVNRKTFAHASHPSFLPAFLPSRQPMSWYKQWQGSSNKLNYI